MMKLQAKTRPLTNEERRLARWILEHGSREASDFIVQLDHSEASKRRCPCGCASFDFLVEGKPAATPGVRVLGDFVFGDKTNLAGIFIYSSAGILSGVEVYGLASDAPATLPEPESLRHLEFEIKPPLHEP